MATIVRSDHGRRVIPNISDIALQPLAVAVSNAALSWARAQRGMTPCERLVLMILADCANGDDCSCWPSQDALAEETGMPRPSISRTIKRLASLGKIEIGGHANRRTYRLAVTTCDDSTVPTSDGKVPPSYVSVTSGQPNVTSSYTNPKEPKITQKEDSSLRSASEPNPVEQIWSRGLAILGSNRRSLLGRMVKEHGQVAVLEAIIATEAEMPVEPAAFLLGCLARAGPKVNGKHPGTYRPGALAAFAEGAFNAAQAYNRKHGLDIENDLSPPVALLGRQ